VALTPLSMKYFFLGEEQPILFSGATCSLSLTITAAGATKASRILVPQPVSRNGGHSFLRRRSLKSWRNV